MTKPQLDVRKIARAIGSALLVPAFVLLGFFLGRPARVALETLDDEAREVRKLDDEVKTLQEQLVTINAGRAARYEAVVGHARGRLGLPLGTPLDFDRASGKWNTVAPVTTEVKSK